FRPSDLIRHLSFVICHSLLVLLSSASICLAQKRPERPPPLDPVLAEKEARALVADLLAQKPAENSTNTGSLTIRDARGQEREIAARFEIVATRTNWLSVYEACSANDRPGRTRLSVVHTDHQPNQYQLLECAGPDATNAAL